MKNWKLVTVAAACLSVAMFSAACTVEEDDGTGDAGAAGAAGAAAGAGGAAAGAAGAAGGAAVPQTFADFFDKDDIGTDSDCGVCLKTSCAAEQTACGDVAATGAGACKDAANCLVDNYKETDANYDCAFETCGNAAATTANAGAVNDMFLCVQEKCATQCFVTAGFGNGNACTKLSRFSSSRCNERRHRRGRGAFSSCLIAGLAPAWAKQPPGEHDDAGLLRWSGVRDGTAEPPRTDDLFCALQKLFRLIVLATAPPEPFVATAVYVTYK